MNFGGRQARGDDAITAGVREGRTRGHVQGAARGNAEQWTWAAAELGGHDEEAETRHVRVLEATKRRGKTRQARAHRRQHRTRPPPLLLLLPLTLPRPRLMLMLRLLMEMLLRPPLLLLLRLPPRLLLLLRQHG